VKLSVEDVAVADSPVADFCTSLFALAVATSTPPAVPGPAVATAVERVEVLFADKAYPAGALVSWCDRPGTLELTDAG
jgi:hypothetical protein